MITLVNESKYGLQFSIFDENYKKKPHLTNLIHTGGIHINQAAVSYNELPWGGVKKSGFGRDNGFEGVESFALIKTISYKHK